MLSPYFSERETHTLLENDPRRRGQKGFKKSEVTGLHSITQSTGGGMFSDCFPYLNDINQN